ncbi:hypothetical protein Btru_048122 [Bulinus truncatus]|nr:hypothetical protein Btru_048122 [Bulinus truncatus]
MSRSKVELDNVTGSRKILLVGRSGNGKTSTINSIRSVTSNDRTIIAVECPGVGDTGEDRKEDIDTVINNVEREIKDCSVRAIVLVLKYGVRFTKQEKDAAEDVRKIFGGAALHKYGILVLTYGDLFDVNSGQTGQTFEAWYAEQQGEIKLLFEEVNNRVVLFNNKTKDPEQLNQQFNSLYRCVCDIDNEYTTSEFNLAFTDRRLLLSNENVPRTQHHVDLLSENPHLLGGKSQLKSVIASNLSTGICYLVFALLIFMMLIFKWFR